MRTASTTTKYRGSALSASLLTALLALTGCGASQGDPLDELLRSEATSADVAPSEVVDQTAIIERTLRYVGADDDARGYYVGNDDSGGTCLLVLESPQEWGSACGSPGSFSVAVSDVVAWLSSPTFQDHTASQRLREIVFIADVGSEYPPG